MRRREFIALLGGAMAARPLAAQAQQGERARRIGVIMSLAADDRETQARHAAFLQGLQQLGWIDGRNARIEFRGATDADHIRRYAAELVALAPDVILSSGTAVAGTRSIDKKINQQQGAFKTERSFGFREPCIRLGHRPAASPRAAPGQMCFPRLANSAAFLHSFEPRNFLNLLGCNAWSAVSRTCS